MEHESSGGAGYGAVIRRRARDWDRRVAPLHVFGGRPLLGAELPLSRVAGRPFHLTLDIDLSDARLAALGLASLRRLAILGSFHVHPTSDAPLLVRHHDEGRRLELLAEPDGSLVPGIPDELPQLPVELETVSDAEAACETVDELPDDHAPVHRVGGRAIWTTRPLEPPRCPLTGLAMRFIAQVDSERRFPLRGSETQLLFGDSGILYVFWSDGPAVSAAIVQSR